MKHRRQALAQPTPQLSLRRKAALLDVHRSGVYYRSKPAQDDQVEVMNQLRDLYQQYPFMGYRRLHLLLRQRGYQVNGKRVLSLMRLMGLAALYPKKNLSKRDHKASVSSYLLKERPAVKVNDVWQIDITYLRMEQGFLYLTALIDMVSRRIMGWDLSPFLETESCLSALRASLSSGYQPLIINTDRGSQFTSAAWRKALEEAGIVLSHNGAGRCCDNVLIERFWRSVKYEEVYLKSYASVQEARASLSGYISWYNSTRAHQSLGYKSPDSVFYQGVSMLAWQEGLGVIKQRGERGENRSDQETE
ncbi:MAG: IS3 family transposase [Roseivirga sp.]